MAKSATGTRLHVGHCAVDPKKIPYGSRVVLPDGTTLAAVDTGSAVQNRKAARRAGRNSDERSAIVITNGTIPIVNAVRVAAEARGGSFVYYEIWLATFEDLLAKKGLVTADELEETTYQFEFGEREAGTWQVKLVVSGDQSQAVTTARSWIASCTSRSM